MIVKKLYLKNNMIYVHLEVPPEDYANFQVVLAENSIDLEFSYNTILPPFNLRFSVKTSVEKTMETVNSTLKKLKKKLKEKEKNKVFKYGGGSINLDLASKLDKEFLEPDFWKTV